MLWLAYANDLFPPNVSTLKYADDTTLYCAIKKTGDANVNHLAESLIHAETWSKKNGMLLNSAKTQTMKINLKKDSYHCNIAGNSPSEYAKLLDIIIDATLTVV